MPIPPIAPPARLSELFPPVVPDNPDPQTFELGLVLGGTVSEGAYTAGALDFLLEALEAWQPSAAVMHRVVIKTAAGSSGGAVCTSILGLLSGRIVPHIKGAYADLVANTADQQNPLWDLWINRLQIMPMLSNTDIASNQNVDAGTGAVLAHVQHVAALLNADVITQAGNQLALFGATPAQKLPYFAQPFRAAVTVANLRGIPYQIADLPSIGNFAGAAYVQHDDFAWFAFPNGADSAAPLPTGKREDEFWLGAGDAALGFVGYDTLVSFATASGAMPLVLASRALSRPAEHYNYRPIVRAVTDLAAGYRIDWPLPDWTCLTDAVTTGTYKFTAADGGTLNNDPVSLVHRSLMGLVGRNPRGKSDANRAILMIDPLADTPQPIAPTGKSLLAVLGCLVPTLVGGARYLTADMALFADADVFSRFQLVPFRPASGAGPAAVGEAALAGDSLFAAGGWCAREFRVHDFLLGRHNMQAYLRNQLLLAGDNPLFKNWQFGDRQDYATDANGVRIEITAATPPGSYFLPIIPDKTVDGPLNLPPWPVGAFNPADLSGPLKARLSAVGDALIADNTGGGVLPWLASLFAVPGIVDFIADAVVNDFTAALEAAGLWPGAK